MKPYRLLPFFLRILLGCAACSAADTVRLYAPDALADMGRMERAAFDAKWPAVEPEEGNLPADPGFWVAYRHLDLTILVGPYEEKAGAEAALSILEGYRARLMMEEAPKFGSSTVGILENRLSSGDGYGAKLPKGPLSREDVVTLQDPGTGEVSPETKMDAAASELTGGVGYGFISTPPSVLSALPEVYPPFPGRALRSEEDLSKRFPPAGSQAPQNACSGWVVGYALKSYHESVEEGWSTWSFWTGANLNNTFSPAYVYNQINGGVDEGAMLPVCLALVKTSGVCRWPRMPFDPADFTRQPSEIAHRDAQKYRIDFFGYVPPDNLDAIKGFLAGGFPLVVGMMSDPDFEALKKDDVWSTYDPGQGELHAVMVVGYDDRKKAFKVFNSWGNDWGRKGFGWVAYDLWPDVVLEVFAVKDAKNDPLAPVWERTEFTGAIESATRTPTGGITVSGAFEVPQDYEAVFRVAAVLEDKNGTPIQGGEIPYRTVNGQIGAATLANGSRWNLDIPARALAEMEAVDVYVKAILYVDDFGLTASERVLAKGVSGE
jgi:hypothetical protein